MLHHQFHRVSLVRRMGSNALLPQALRPSLQGCSQSWWQSSQSNLHQDFQFRLHFWSRRRFEQHSHQVGMSSPRSSLLRYWSSTWRADKYCQLRSSTKVKIHCPWSSLEMCLLISLISKSHLNLHQGTWLPNCQYQPELPPLKTTWWLQTFKISSINLKL